MTFLFTVIKEAFVFEIWLIHTRMKEEHVTSDHLNVKLNSGNECGSGGSQMKYLIHGEKKIDHILVYRD